ncbi:MAG: hypothetical protein GTN36_06115, partial [Candidatus Aenigmarchaeota archaeon]|nr:hypothetical protein [Candidatus Aenigmarchaeota archaeon]
MLSTIDRIFVSDCEGPISKNDNAFELTKHLVPNGGNFFTRISKYDDVLADVVKKPGYKAGDTLKLILPFLKAHEVTDEMMEDYSSKNILLVPGAKDSLEQIRSFMPAFIISTSYRPYIRSLCEEIGFPVENTYSTEVRIDNYGIKESEKTKLQDITGEIVGMPVLTIPDSNRMEDFSEADKRNKERLDEIFWKIIPKMDIGKIIEEVNPVGGYEKAKALGEIIEKKDTKRGKTMYVGDSITDVQSLQKIKDVGLPVSFNGNNYAIREADIAVLSSNAMITSVLAAIFNEHGRDGVISSVIKWND